MKLHCPNEILIICKREKEIPIMCYVLFYDLCIREVWCAFVANDGSNVRNDQQCKKVEKGFINFW